MSTKFTYNLEYAGIPFGLDLLYGQEEDEAVSNLMEYLEKKISFHYLQDFSLPAGYPGRNIGAIAYQWQVGPMPSPEVKIGDWYYPNTASRWSVFRMLAPSSIVKAMLAATNGNPATFTMQAVPIGPSNPSGASTNFTVSTYMYMLPPRPLMEHGGKFDGMYLMTLVDERYYWQFNPINLRPTPGTTWQTLINQLAEALGTTITVQAGAIPAVYGNPEYDSQFWVNQESAALLLDAVAFNIGCCVVRNLNGTYTLQTPLSSQATVNTNRGNANSVVRVAGGDLFLSGTNLRVGNLGPSRNTVLPPSITISFPKYVQGDDPVPHFSNPRYAGARPSTWYETSFGDCFLVNVPLTSGGSQFSGLGGVIPPSGASAISGIEIASGFSHSIHTTAKALYSGENQLNSNPINASGLTALAIQIAQDYFNGQVASAIDEVYPGSFVWTPEGIHDVIWSFSHRERGAYTRIIRAEWNQIVREMQHGTPALSGSTSTPKGVGGNSVAQTVRDSYSGSVSTTLAAQMQSGDFTATLTAIDNLPTQNRWRGQVDNEKILFEGTSGGTLVGVVWRGIDGTIQTSHSNGASLSLVTPNTSYGVNLITEEKGQYTHPAEWTSGGIQGARRIPQTQSVQVLASSGAVIKGINHYSGQVLLYDATQLSGSQFVGLERCWVIERNAQAVTSGRRYDGQYVGPSASGQVAPIYAVTEYPSSGGGSSTPDPPGSGAIPPPGITTTIQSGGTWYIGGTAFVSGTSGPPVMVIAPPVGVMGGGSGVVLSVFGAGGEFGGTTSSGYQSVSGSLTNSGSPVPSGAASSATFLNNRSGPAQPINLFSAPSMIAPVLVNVTSGPLKLPSAPIVLFTTTSGPPTVSDFSFPSLPFALQDWPWFKQQWWNISPNPINFPFNPKFPWSTGPVGAGAGFGFQMPPGTGLSVVGDLSANTMQDYAASVAAVLNMGGFKPVNASGYAPASGQTLSFSPSLNAYVPGTPVTGTNVVQVTPGGATGGAMPTTGVDNIASFLIDLTTTTASGGAVINTINANSCIVNLGQYPAATQVIQAMIRGQKTIVASGTGAGTAFLVIGDTKGFGSYDLMVNGTSTAPTSGGQYADVDTSSFWGAELFSLTSDHGNPVFAYNSLASGSLFLELQSTNVKLNQFTQGQAIVFVEYKVYTGAFS